VQETYFLNLTHENHGSSDGNGRTGRMLLNYILMKNDYPPLIIHNKTRSEYLAFLKDADKAGLETNKKEDHFKLVQYIVDEMIDFYWDIFL